MSKTIIIEVDLYSLIYGNSYKLQEDILANIKLKPCFSLRNKFVKYLDKKNLVKTETRLITLWNCQYLKSNFTIEQVKKEFPKKIRPTTRTVINNVNLLIDAGIVEYVTTKKRTKYYKLK